MADGDPSDVFDEPTAWRFRAVERLGLTGTERIAGLSIGAGYPESLAPIREAMAGVAGWVGDVGSGLGAAAAWVGAATSAVVVAMEPEPRAASLARAAFPELPVVDATATALPLATASCAGSTALGLVSLLPDLDPLVAELRRVVAPGGRIGLTDLVTTADATVIPETGNHLRPLDALTAAFDAHGIAVDAVTWTSPEDAGWADVAAAVDAEIDARHRGTAAHDAWRRDGDLIGRLLADGRLRIVTIVATRR